MTAGKRGLAFCRQMAWHVRQHQVRLIAGKRGQAIALDLLFAVLIFLLLLNSGLLFLGSSNSTVEGKGLLDDLEARAIQSLDMLVRTAGKPDDWQLKSIGDVTFLGLAKRDRVLDEAKVERFRGWIQTYGSSDYNRVKSLLLIGYDYYFKMTDSSGSILQVKGNNIESGVPAGSSWDKMKAINLKRVVNFRGEAAIVEFAIYYPQR